MVFSLTKDDDYASRKAAIARQEKLAEMLSQMGAQEQAVSTAGGITAPVSGMGALARGLSSFGGAYLSGKAAGDEAALKKAGTEELVRAVSQFGKPYKTVDETAPDVVEPGGEPIAKYTMKTPDSGEMLGEASRVMGMGIPGSEAIGAKLYSTASDTAERETAYNKLKPSINAITNPEIRKYLNIAAMADPKKAAEYFGDVAKELSTPTKTSTKNPYPAIGQDGKPAMFRDDEFGNPVPVPGMTPYSAAATNVTVKLPPGLNSADDALGKMYAEYITGDTASGEKNMNQLGMAINYMVKNPNISGGLTGALPIQVRSLFPSLKAGANVQQMMEDVVQANLKKVLGSQFIAKEAEGLMKRIYDPQQLDAVNVDRATRLLKSVQEAAQAKDDAMRYFGQNNTISGYKPKYAMVRSVDDIIYNAGLTGVDVSGNKPENKPKKPGVNYSNPHLSGGSNG